MSMTLTYDEQLSRVRVTWDGILNPNHTFDENIDTWGASGGTLTWSTAQAQSGAGSALLTPDGVAAIVLGQQADFAAMPMVVPGEEYLGRGYFFSVGGLAQVSIVLTWRDAGNNILSTSSSTIAALPAGAWTFQQVVATAPANAAKAQLRARIHGTPTVSQTMFIDNMRISASNVALYDVERSTNGITWTPVRGGTDPQVVNVHEQVPIPLAQLGFEASTAGWFASGAGPVVRSTAQAHLGAASGLLTPDGVTATAQTGIGVSAAPTAVVGAGYRVTVWVYSPNGYSDVRATIAWLNGVGAIISESFGQLTSVAAGVWTERIVVGIAPPGTVTVSPRVQMTGTPAGSDTLFVDDLLLSIDVPGHNVDDYEFAADVPSTYRITYKDAGGDVLSRTTATITADLGGKVWLKSLARPFLNRPVELTGLEPEYVAPSRNGVFPVVGRTNRVAVTDVRTSEEFEVEIITSGQVEKTNVRLLFASGDPLFLHVPADHCAIDESMYVVAGDVSRRRQSPTLDRRLFRVPLIQVAAPGPDVVGATITYQSLLSSYATYADLLAAFATYADILEGIGDPSDVIVP